jgi:hypothetical protein
MEREPENVIDGTARAHQWRRSRSTMVDDGPDGGQARSDAPKSIAASLLVPVELLTDAAPLEQAPPHAGRSADHGRADRAPGDARLAPTAHENPFLVPEAAAPDNSSAQRRRVRVTRRVGAAFAAIGSPRRWLLAPHWPTGRSAPSRTRRLRSRSSSPLARLRRLVRPGSVGADRWWRRAPMTGLLATVVVAASCVVLASIATDGGHPRVAQPAPSRDRQLAAVGAGNDPFGDRRAVIAARAAAAKTTTKAVAARKTSAKAKARTRRLARARIAARRARQHRPRAAVPAAAVTTATPATATAPVAAPPTSSPVQASTAAARHTGGSTATGGSSSLPPGPTGIGSIEGSNCNPKCS